LSAAALVASTRVVKVGGISRPIRVSPFVTPIQGNRKGYDDAAEHDGAWETSGIFQYSELDKSLDNCLYVFTTPEISATGQIKMGSCKYRRGADIPSTFVPLNVGAGMLIDDRSEQPVKVSVAVKAVVLPKKVLDTCSSRL
jgi:hypothetical protein